MMDNNRKQTVVTYDLTEILNYYKNKLSSHILIFNGKEYTFRKFLSIVLILSPVSIFLFNLNKLEAKTFLLYFLVFIFVLILAGSISLFVIINPYSKKNARILLKTKKEHGFKAFLTFWPIDDFRNYQKVELIKYFKEKEVTELTQYELISKTIDCNIKSKKPSLIIKFGVLFSLLMAVWLQINQQIIEKIDDVNFLLEWGLLITVLVAVLWHFANQILIGHSEIINTDNRRNEQLNKLLKEIIFDMKMKK